MAFYYEAEPPNWKFKQRYGGWKGYPSSCAKRLEKLWKTVHVKKDSSKVVYQWTDEQKQKWDIDVQKMEATASGSYYRPIEISREGYPYPKPSGDKKSLNKIFDKYQSAEDQDLMSEEKVGDFFQNCKIDCQKIESFVILGLMELRTGGDVERELFVNNLSKCGCSKESDIAKLVKRVTADLHKPDKTKKLKAFAAFLFNLLKEGQASSWKLETALNILPILFENNKKYPMCKPFVAYVDELNDIYEEEFEKGPQHFSKLQGDEETMIRAKITKDDWLMCVSMIEETKDVGKFDPDDGWPEFVTKWYDWMNSKQPEKES